MNKNLLGEKIKYNSFYKKKLVSFLNSTRKKNINCLETELELEITLLYSYFYVLDCFMSPFKARDTIMRFIFTLVAHCLHTFCFCCCHPAAFIVHYSLLIIIIIQTNIVFKQK